MTDKHLIDNFGKADLPTHSQAHFFKPCRRRNTRLKKKSLPFATRTSGSAINKLITKFQQNN